MVVINHREFLCEEEKRLKEDREKKKYWKRWGTYVAERQWATGTSLSLRLRIPLTLPISKRGLFVSILEQTSKV